MSLDMIKHWGNLALLVLTWAVGAIVTGAVLKVMYRLFMFGWHAL